MAAALVAVVTGCSSGGPAGTQLETALARVSDTANTRAAIYYDNTSELVSLAGKSLSAERTGYGELLGMGATNILEFMATLPGDTGINLFNESYSITAGNPPDEVTLIAGGQDASQVTSRLTKIGYKKAADGTLTAPPLTSSGTGSTYSFSIAKARAVNSDVLIGTSAADLSQVGSPQGTTLADDPDIKALAACLGNVVAATFVNGSGVTAAPTEVAMGISQPASATATPHAVVCVSWPTQAAADTYAANVRKALATGLSPALDRRFSALLPHATVTNVGGDAHVVEWQADPSSVETVFSMLENIALPALPDCAKMTPAEKAQIIGCG